MNSPASPLHSTLLYHKLSHTKPRALVFAALERSEPLTMPELIKMCSPHINRASIYRTVVLFEQVGILQRLQIGWKYKLELSNNFQKHHHHLTCTQCGSTVPLKEDPTLEKRLLQMARSYQFEAHDHQLEIRGICSTCQN